MSSGDTPEEVSQMFARYREYLSSIKSKLPGNAFEFASADWHYNAEDSRSPHDAWIENVTISERARGSSISDRHVTIEIVLLGAYHDGRIVISYEGVFGYSLEQCKSSVSPDFHSHCNSHGDWLIDEISINDQGGLVHFIEFSNNVLWEIRCKDIHYKWIPFENLAQEQK